MSIPKRSFCGIVRNSSLVAAHAFVLLPFARRCGETLQGCRRPSVKSSSLRILFTSKKTFLFRFFEFDVPTKSKVTRKKETLLSNAQWQIDIDENLLPDERMLLERDFSIEIPRESTPPTSVQSPVCSSLIVDYN
jgi:hypothetical protein